MSDTNREEKLLKFFEDTNVPLGNLSPDVIRGWFDTDDQDQKDLLNWMCTSLTTANYVSPPEVEEFNSIQNEITEQELIRVEEEHPDIFNVEELEMKTKRLQGKIDLALQEEQRLDESISKHEKLKKQLYATYQRNIHTEEKSTVKLDIAKEQCNTLANKLDEIHYELLKWSDDSGKYLYEWRYDPIPSLINGISVKNLQENFNSLVPILEVLISDRYANSTMPNEGFNNRLDVIKNRIEMSQKCRIISNVRKEEALAKLNYLRSNDISQLLLPLPEDLQDLYNDIEAKEQLKLSMSNVIKQVSYKITDSKLLNNEFKYQQEQLQSYQNHFNQLDNVENVMVKIIFMYSVVNILCKLERSDIENGLNCSKYITKVISSIQNCSIRIDKMQEVITNYESIPQEKRFNLVYSIAKIISNDDINPTLSNAFNTLINLKSELNQTEIKVYDSLDHVLLKNALKENISTLRSFLMSGPTCQPVIIPNVLQIALREMEGELQNHANVLTHIVSIFNNKKQCSKWENYRQHLWMYFYTDPYKLKFAFEQIKMELTRMRHAVN